MMKPNAWLAAFTIFGGTVLWAGDPGVRPRFDAKSYPTSATVAQGTVAAAALSHTEVHDNFAADLNKGFLVFEVSFYPNTPGEMKISPTDFVLRVKRQDDPIRPAEPAVVARSIAEKGKPKQATAGGVTVIPVASVGYETGTYNNGNNPNGNNGANNNGTQRHSGVYSSVGVVVEGAAGVGPSAYPVDRYSMEAELFDKSLPEGPIKKATAGYLYFPLPKGKPGAAYELQYTSDTGVVKLVVPVPHEK